MVFGPRFSSTGRLPTIVPLELDAHLIAFLKKLPFHAYHGFAFNDGSGQDMTGCLKNKLLEASYLSFFVDS